MKEAALVTGSKTQTNGLLLLLLLLLLLQISKHGYFGCDSYFTAWDFGIFHNVSAGDHVVFNFMLLMYLGLSCMT